MVGQGARFTRCSPSPSWDETLCLPVTSLEQVYTPHQRTQQESSCYTILMVVSYQSGNRSADGTTSQCYGRVRSTMVPHSPHVRRTTVVLQHNIQRHDTPIATTGLSLLGSAPLRYTINTTVGIGYPGVGGLVRFCSTTCVCCMTSVSHHGR